MKAKLLSIWSRRALITCACLLIPAFSTSCTTTYDAYGNQRQSVDPGMAAAGAVAAGVLGYALANDNDDRSHRGRYHRGRDYHHGHYGHYARHSRYGRY